MAKLTKDELFAIMSEEIATHVATDATPKGESNPTQVFRTVPTSWHPDVMRRAVRIAFGRFHGQFMAGTPIEGGAKAKAFGKLVDVLNKGEIPEELKGGGRSATGKLSDFESVLCEIFEARLMDKVRGNVTGTGKNGRVLNADIMEWLANNKKTAYLTRAVGDGYAFDRETILATESIVRANREAAEEEMERRNRIAEAAESADLGDLGLE